MAGWCRPIYDGLFVRQHPQHHRVPADGRAARTAAAARLLRRNLSAPRQDRASSSSIRSAGSSGRPTARRFRATSRVVEAGHADAGLGAVSEHHGGLGLDHEPRRAAEPARALRVEHLHPRLRRGDPVAGLHARSAATRHDACRAKGYDPGKLLEVHETVHQRLGRRGVRSIQFAHRSYAGSAYNTVASAGAKIVRHSTPAEGLVQLKEALLATTGKACSASTGPRSTRSRTCTGPAPATTPPRSRASGAPSTRSSRMSRAPTRSISSPPTTATSMPTRAPTIYINERIPALADCLPREPHRQSDLSQRLAARHLPARAARAPRRGAAAAAPRARRCRADPADGGRCWRRACSARPRSCPELRRRLGDILILPYLGNFIWWREPGRMQNDFYGHHGGLSPRGADHRGRHHRRAVAADGAGVPCRGLASPLQVAVGDDRGHEPISAVGAVPWITLQEADEFIVLRGLLAYEAACTRLSEIVVGVIVPPMVMDTENALYPSGPRSAHNPCSYP